jgi:hypothetical protein
MRKRDLNTLMMKVKYLMFCGVTLCLMLTTAHAQTDTIVRVGAYWTEWWCPWNVVVRGDYAYVADLYGVTSVNVSNPGNPCVGSREGSGSAIGLLLQDTLAYLNTTGTSFHIISVANPDSLYHVGRCPRSSCAYFWPTGICVKDTVAYLANSEYGIVMINVADPSAPDTIPSYDTPRHVLDLAVRDSLLYVVDLDTLRILNVRDPLNVSCVGKVGTTEYFHGIWVVGDYAYLACLSGGVGIDGKLMIVDISDPIAPRIASVSDWMLGDPVDVHVSGDYAYIAAEDCYWSRDRKRREAVSRYVTHSGTPVVEGGLRIVNVKNPDSCYVVASYNTPGNARGVFVKDDLVFVADYDSLQILRHIRTDVEEGVNSQSAMSNGQLSIHPNPFTHNTVVEFVVGSSEFVDERQRALKIYDLGGRLVRSLQITKSPNHQISKLYWDGTDQTGHKVPGGMYFCEAKNGSSSIKSKLVIMH